MPWRIFLLLLVGAVGLDAGILLLMSKAVYARGVITYLFAVLCFGTAMVLVLHSLTSPEGSDDARFDRAKDVLALMLGVFGTIVGFYFGQEVG